ncbi:MAG: threonine synthase [Propionibacteriaceae bacterium]|jgi:threonine synthase|nr:threonine synthase [Propionibacteriaceae bacterium]
MRYVSTRGRAAPASFSDILLEGLAPDGGLYWPEAYPRLDRADRAELRALYAAEGYPRLACAILSRFADDLPSDDLLALCRRAYAPAKFGSADTVPVTDLGGGLHLAHLSNGPTAAFKDLALQLLAELFEYELERRDQTLTILGATSGDTGSAAEWAMLGKARVSVFMLSPQGRMTPFQRGQMYGLDDPRITNITVPGAFDDCQDLVKAVNADAAFKAAHSLGAVNSINWARLAAQVVYYVASWLRVTRDDDAPAGFCVPTGNFGNIIAAHIARQMGFPIDHIVLATNENNVLAEFFATGRYRVRAAAETVATSSPSMDISKASNFERFVFDLVGRDAAETARLFGAVLPAVGEFTVTPDLLRTARTAYAFSAGTSTHADRVATIRSLYERTGVLIDPHTADGVTVAEHFVTAGHADAAPLVCMETALPIKFADTITEAIGHPAPIPERFAGVLSAAPHTVDLAPGDGPERVKEIISGRGV